MTNATNKVARVAAAVAGFGLVAMSFAPLAGAQTSTTTTTTSTTMMYAFTRDLTIGSTGADVTALQTWLMSKGYSIPAGATGYFGSQTQAALAAFQAANMISPAAGYFGPITRAKVASMGMGTTTGGTTTTTPGGTTTTTTTSTLKGGEADLRDYDLRSEESDGNEGEEDVKAATAEFDVEDGDVDVQRAELTLHAQDDDDSIESKPWQFIDKVTVYGDGKELASMDTDSRDDWDEEDVDDNVFGNGGDDEMYTVQFSDLDYIVRQNDTAKITFSFDVNDNIDTDDQAQQFDLAVLEDGIRAIDSEGVNQYVGSDSDENTVNFGFDSEENGDLSIRENSDNPDSTTLKVEDDENSDEYTIFKFDIRNSDDADSLLNELTLSATTSASGNLRDIIRKATLETDGDEYDADINNGTTAGDGTLDFDDIDMEIKKDSTAKFTLKVEFASQDGHYADGTTVMVGLLPAGVDAEGAESGDDVDEISGAASSETHTLALTGFDVSSNSTDQRADNQDTGTASTGTFTIKFDVTADEDDQLFVDNTAADINAGASTTAGAIFRVLRNGSATTTTAFTSENAVLTSSADMEGGAYRIDAGSTETFTLTVTIDPTATGLYAVELTGVNYGDTPAHAVSAPDNTTFMVDTDNSDFETDPISINA